MDNSEEARNYHLTWYVFEYRFVYPVAVFWRHVFSENLELPSMHEYDPANPPSFELL